MALEIFDLHTDLEHREVWTLGLAHHLDECTQDVVVNDRSFEQVFQSGTHLSHVEEEKIGSGKTSG